MSGIVALIGMMGGGKTSVGQLLAEQTNLPFVDTDALAEAAAGMTVADIFRRQGEAAFRQIESQALESALRDLRGGGWLSAGGGVVLSAANRRLLRENTFCVYLSATAALLATRLAGDAAAARPLLSTDGAATSEEDITAQLEELTQKRRALYEQTAHAVVAQDTGDSPATVAKKVLQAIQTTQSAPQAD